MTDRGEEIELTDVLGEPNSDPSDPSPASTKHTDSRSPDVQDDGQTRTQKLVEPGEGKYLNAPPKNWTRQSWYPWDCLFHFLGKMLGGRFTHEPEDMVVKDASLSCQLSDKTQEILRERVFHDLDPSDVVDYHVHVVGHGDSGSKCYIHDNLKTWWRPYNKIKAAVFMAAAQVPDEEGGDMQYVSRLIRLVKHFVPSCVLSDSSPEKDPGELYRHHKLCLLAFDSFHEKDGRENREKTTFYIPNDYVYSLVKDHPDYFYPVGSVNPYRKDALEELEKCAQNGVSIIKWLPNSMGIDLSDNKCVPFYRKLKELDMALLVHVGEEHSVDAAYLDNSLGNPLHLRHPLTNGVKVIAAHCASEGYAVDLESKERPQPKISCYELFIRLMKRDVFKGKLFADISAVCAFKRVEFLTKLMDETDIHDRLVYGSDYPVPAINIVVHTSKLQRAGLITTNEKEALNELYNFNPILFDLACKRLLKSSEKKGFPASVFKEHPLLPPMRKTPFKAKDDSQLRHAVADRYEEYKEDSSIDHEEVQKLQVEVEVHDEDTSSKHSQEQAPITSPSRSGGQTSSGQDDGEIEVEESNEETKLLPSSKP